MKEGLEREKNEKSWLSGILCIKLVPMHGKFGSTHLVLKAPHKLSGEICQISMFHIVEILQEKKSPL
jgi:hypothetical protein